LTSTCERARQIEGHLAAGARGLSYVARGKKAREADVTEQGLDGLLEWYGRVEIGFCPECGRGFSTNAAGRWCQFCGWRDNLPSDYTQTKKHRPVDDIIACARLAIRMRQELMELRRLIGLEWVEDKDQEAVYLAGAREGRRLAAEAVANSVVTHEAAGGISGFYVSINHDSTRQIIYDSDVEVRAANMASRVKEVLRNVILGTEAKP
jgi:hypothetical protein